MANQEQQVEHFSHNHPLTPVSSSCISSDSHYIPCSLCSNPVQNSSDGSIIYVCFECNIYVIHKSCYELPREFQHHPFYPQYTLTLTPINFSLPPGHTTCSFCDRFRKGWTWKPSSYEHNKGPLYKCDNFVDVALHFKCAMLMPSIEDIEGRIQHHSHQHPLFPFPFLEWRRINDGLICSGCEGTLSDTSYVCPQCMFFLCTSCVGEMSQQIKHPFHPQHLLTFFRETLPYSDDTISCKICDSTHWHNGFIYHCAACDFYMGLSCASVPTIKYEPHEHDLAFIKSTRDSLRRNCRNCNAPCHSHFLRCVLCDFNLHVQCIPSLPCKVKVKTHRHVLTLTDPLPEDGSSKYYCDACEKERNPKHSVYYCPQCEFVAHIQCQPSEQEFFVEGEVSTVFQKLLDAGIDDFDFKAGDDDIRGANEEEEEDDGFSSSSTEPIYYEMRMNSLINEITRSLKRLLQRRASREASRQIPLEV